MDLTVDLADFDKQPERSPEHNLFYAVLHLALLDARSGSVDAKRYFNSMAFSELACFLNLDEDAFLERLHAHIGAKQPAFKRRKRRNDPEQQRQYYQRWKAKQEQRTEQQP